MLDKLKSPKQKKNRIRVGRGYGSHRGGHTSGRGQKGQKSRSGNKRPRPGFEGGAMPLSRRLPKLKGFSREYIRAREKSIIINLDQLNKFKDGEEITIETLVKKGLVKNESRKVNVKILANGKLEKKLKLSGLKVSEKAKKIIEKTGGEVK